MKFMKFVKKALDLIRVAILKHCDRLRYRAICRALNLKVIGWQKRFVIDNKKIPRTIKHNRGTGTTTAVILKLLMQKPPYLPKTFNEILAEDPSLCSDNAFQDFSRRYSKACKMCASHKVPCFSSIIFQIGHFEANNYRFCLIDTTRA